MQSKGEHVLGRELGASRLELRHAQQRECSVFSKLLLLLRFRDLDPEPLELVHGRVVPTARLLHLWGDGAPW